MTPAFAGMFCFGLLLLASWAGWGAALRRLAFPWIIAGRALAISPMVMLVAFFFWAFLWGLPGAFIGIPVTIALLTACEHNPSLGWLTRLLSAPS